MSKWINKDLFNQFANQKKQEKDAPSGGGMMRSDMVWRTPEKGTADRAKVYEGRFLVDPKGVFYKKFYYHMFQVGDKWQFFLCPKTFGFDEYCDLCTVTSKLYMGDSSDKKSAYQFKRKEKFVGNFYIVSDPRDAENDEKVGGTVKLYEFPGKVEVKLKEQITDTQNGLGPAIFDPGPDGFNFILKVGATKKDRNGNIWPDYGLSDFSRRSGALGTEKEINDIMASTYDIDEYIQSRERPEEDIMSVLKQLMFEDLVKSDRKMAASLKSDAVDDDIPDFDKKGKVEILENQGSDEVPFDTGDEAIDTDELLKQLDDI